VPPTTAELIGEQDLGALIAHRDISLSGRVAPQYVARHELRTALIGRASDERVDEVVLVADELIGNAVEHSKGPDSLSLDIYERGAAVGVADLSNDPDALSSAAGCAIESTDGPVDYEKLPEGGRGLFLVGLLSTAWSVYPAENGKLVMAVFVLVGGDD